MCRSADQDGHSGQPDPVRGVRVRRKGHAQVFHPFLCTINIEVGDHLII